MSVLTDYVDNVTPYHNMLFSTEMTKDELKFRDRRVG